MNKKEKYKNICIKYGVSYPVNTKIFGFDDYKEQTKVSELSL